MPVPGFSVADLAVLPGSRIGRALCGAVVGAVLLVAMLGCARGASVTVNTTVPSPLVKPIPVKMGVYFDDALTAYVHVEEVPDHGEYRIDLGASQVPVFERVFDAMFQDVTRIKGKARENENAAPFLDALQSSGANVDAVLAPTIEEMQFAIPAQTKGDFYEVWIKYRMKLFATDGTLIADWDLLGYGKANSDNYGSVGTQDDALGDATIWALRDAAAFLSFYFPTVDGVREWLEGRGLGA
ncbi:MAG: hypothetical protein OXI55_18175 [Gammaproteobacteria bacterium]|nr:hypothetical protein [Gammaproteobacteria bacterium]